MTTYNLLLNAILCVVTSVAGDRAPKTPIRSGVTASETHVNRQIKRFGEYIEFDADGRIVFVASSMNVKGAQQLTAWSLTDGMKIWSVDCDADDRPNFFALSPDGKMLVNGSDSRAGLAAKFGAKADIGKLQIWNPENGKGVFSEASRERHVAIAFGPKKDEFATLGFQRIQFWSSGIGEKITRGRLLDEKSVEALSPDGRRVAKRGSTRLC